MGFLKIRSTGDPHNSNDSVVGSLLGPLILGNYRI